MAVLEKCTDMCTADLISGGDLLTVQKLDKKVQI
jgi:hypothetical protein